MTPYELYLVAQVYKEKREEEHKEKITLAYINAAWTAQWFGKNKPRPLAKILEGMNPKKAMTDEEMLKQVKALNTMLGGEVK